MNAEFILSAAKPEQFIKTDLPEICFAGRSNVGKSSMINKILGRKNLVKVGNTPGKTRLINFFNIDSKYIFTIFLQTCQAMAMLLFQKLNVLLGAN